MAAAGVGSVDVSSGFAEVERTDDDGAEESSRAMIERTRAPIFSSSQLAFTPSSTVNCT